MSGKVKISKTVQRPSDKEVELFNNKSSKDLERKVDPYLIQSVIDKILGPDGEKYLIELKKLNDSYKSRIGKIGIEIYEEQTNHLITRTIFPN